MTSDQQALLAAVHASPDDVLPRLVFADWLDEHDQPAMAALFRRFPEAIAALPIPWCSGNQIEGL
jgi:uncharacterized protein (TIGR02996 family)